MVYQFVHRDSPQMDESEKKVISRFVHVFKILNRKNGSIKWAYMTNAVVRGKIGFTSDIDIVIFKNDKLFANVEIKRSLCNFEIQKRTIDIAKRISTQLNTALFVVCSPDELFYSNRQDGIIKHIANCTEETISAVLNQEQNIEPQDVSVDDFKSLVSKIISLSELSQDKKSALNKVLNQNTHYRISNTDDGTYSIEDAPDDCFEDRFFLALLGGPFSGKKLCRYTSLASFFRSCNEQSQSMCGLTCMNDKTEVNYVSDWIGNQNTPLDSARESNSCYILSCCDIKQADDLTMWRLYGNDANGVCLCYQVDKDKMDGFILAPICYANSNGNHPELDVIQKIMNTFVSNRRIILKRFSVWKHFFKPYEYSVEHEVRLLFQNECQNQENNDYGSNQRPPFRRKWIHDSSYNIIAPIVTFDITSANNAFPLVLDKVILGPKLKEQETNKNQLDCLVETKGIKFNIDDIALFTDTSSIKHYR